MANRGDVASNHPGTVVPNYTGFFINDDGSLAPIAGSTVTFPVGTSPAQALISRTGSFLFANIFGIPGNSAPQGNSIAPLLIQPDGTLQLIPGGSATAPVDPPLLLGTASHPTLNIVYAGLTGAKEVGVFTYDETGQLSFVAAVPDLGSAGRWCVVSADGNFLYVATTGTDSIGVFAACSAPRRGRPEPVPRLPDCPGPERPIVVRRQPVHQPHGHGPPGQSAPCSLGSQ